MKKQVIKEDAKKQLLQGAKILYDAVSTTLGPMGENAVIQTYGEPMVTHDGVTVAKSIDIDIDDSPGARMGVEMIKVSSSKSNENVGDGTTSSTILSYHIIDKGMLKLSTGKNSQVLRKELESAAKQALNRLSEIAEEVDTEEKAVNIATISSESQEVGDIVGKMYFNLGKDAMVTVDFGKKTDIEHEIIEGYSFDRGVLYPHMITDKSTNSTKIENPVIFISERPVALADVKDLIAGAYAEGHDEFVIIVDDIKKDLEAFAIQQRGTMDIIVIRAPGFGERRLELLNDIAQFVGAKVYKGAEPLGLSDLGTCDKLMATDKETVITGGKDVSKHIKALQVRMDNEESEYEKQKLAQRIGQLRARIGVIKVGGFTEMAAEETKHLVDDAVAATEAALKEGYVPGGGTTYIELSKAITDNTDGAEVLKAALEQPFRILMENCGQRPGVRIKELDQQKFGMGFDAMSGKMVDLKKAGIIDPVLVIKQAIINAVSVAGQVLTAGVLVANKKEKDEEEEE